MCDPDTDGAEARAKALGTFSDEMSMPMLVVDTEMRIVGNNAGALDVFGDKIKKVNIRLREFLACPEQEDVVASALHRKRAVRIEARWKQAIGTAVTMSTIVSTRRDANGRAIGLVLFVEPFEEPIVAEPSVPGGPETSPTDPGVSMWSMALFADGAMDVNFSRVEQFMCERTQMDMCNARMVLWG